MMTLYDIASFTLTTSVIKSCVIRSADQLPRWCCFERILRLEHANEGKQSNDH